MYADSIAFFFLKLMSAGITLQSFEKLFSDERLEENDDLARKYVLSLPKIKNIDVSKTTHMYGGISQICSNVHNSRFKYRKLK